MLKYFSNGKLLSGKALTDLRVNSYGDQYGKWALDSDSASTKKGILPKPGYKSIPGQEHGIGTRGTSEFRPKTEVQGKTWWGRETTGDAEYNTFPAQVRQDAAVLKAKTYENLKREDPSVEVNSDNHKKAFDKSWEAGGYSTKHGTKYNPYRLDNDTFQSVSNSSITTSNMAFSDLSKETVDSNTTDDAITDSVKDTELYKIVEKMIGEGINKEDYLKYMGNLYDSLIKDKQLANFSSRLSRSFGFLDDFRAVSGVVGDRARHAGNNIKSASLNVYNQGRGAVNRFKDDVHKRYVRIDAAKKRNELDKYDYIRMPEKCPNCGALVADYADQLSDHKFKCSECGQIFTVAGPGGQGYLKLGHNNGFDSVKNLEKKVAKQFEDNDELYNN
jgi:ribosomal protein S27AE